MFAFLLQANGRCQTAKTGTYDDDLERAIVRAMSVEHIPSASLCSRDQIQTEA
jgi:hypothetical protein